MKAFKLHSLALFLALIVVSPVFLASCLLVDESSVLKGWFEVLCLVEQREDGSSGVGASSCLNGCKQRGLRAQVVDFTSEFELNNRSSFSRGGYSYAL